MCTHQKSYVQILSRFGTTLACTRTQHSILALTHISQQHLPASPVVPVAHVTNLWMFARPKLLNSLLIFGVYVCLHVNMCVCLHDSPHSCLTCQRMRRWGFVRRQRHRGKSITQCVQGVQCSVPLLKWVVLRDKTCSAKIHVISLFTTCCKWLLLLHLSACREYIQCWTL